MQERKRKEKGGLRSFTVLAESCRIDDEGEGKERESWECNL